MASGSSCPSPRSTATRTGPLLPESAKSASHRGSREFFSSLLASIFAFLLDSYVAFGEEANTARQRAAARILAIEAEMIALGGAPHQDTLRPDLMPGLRVVTKQRAIFYFDVDDTLARVRVLAIFFGGQDHQRAMLLRLFQPD